MEDIKKQAIGEARLILSLTSYPKRIGTAYIPIKKMLENSVKADKVVLYLARQQFENELDDLPKKLVELYNKEDNFTIKFLDGDIKSFKKLLPALKDFPNDFIITIDDDMRYKTSLIEKLLEKSIEFPSTIIAGCVRRVKFDKDGNIAPYRKWEKNTVFGSKVPYKNTPSFCNLMIGAGGVLYPPNSLHPDALTNKFLQLSPHGDDLWFWTMAIRANTKVVSCCKRCEARELFGTQRVALWKNNMFGKCNNDIALKNLMQKYPEVLQKLLDTKDA